MHRGLAAFDHIGQQRHALCKACAGGVHLRRRAQRFDEQRVHTAGQVGFGALQRGVQALQRQCIGTRQDQRLVAVARVERGVQLAAHLGRADHGLAVQVPAAFGKVLVFELHHRRAGALEAAHRALHVERVAETRVAIHDYGRMHAFCDTRQRVLYFAERGQAHVRAPEPRVGDRCARQVQRFEAGLLGNQRRERVVDAWRQQGLGLLQALFQRGAGHGRLSGAVNGQDANCVSAVPAATQPPPMALSRPLPDR